MFDFAREMVVAIASAQAQADGAAKQALPVEPQTAPEFELPRFLAERKAFVQEAAPQRVVREMLEAGRFALLEGSPGLIALLSIAAAVFLMFADSAPGVHMRNPRADDLASRFAAASMGADAADLEERLDFAPRLAIALNARQPVKVLKVQNPGQALPFDALGAVILRGLPDGTTLSAGISVGADQWIVALGDLNHLSMNVPEFVTPSLIRADVVSREGLELGTFVFEVSPLAWVNAKLDLNSLRTGALASPQQAIRQPVTSEKAKRPPQKPASARKARRPANSVLHAPNAVRLEATLPQTSGLPSLGAAAGVYKPASGPGDDARRTLRGPQQPALQDAAVPPNPLEAEAARWGAR